MENSQVYQSNLFDDCASKCEAYGSCGGHRNTLPCGCVWTVKSGKRYQCHKCPILCRERGLNNPNKQLLVKNFASEIANGLSFEKTKVSQTPYKFPLFLPSYTNKYKGNKKFSNWAAVDVREMFNCRKKRGAILNSHFKDEHTLRRYLNIKSDCQLIAILNGTDRMLESIWGASRKEIFNQLASIGFSACTAPTFSITAQTTEKTTVPFSHHTAMYMRHNKVLLEIHDAGLCAIPNLYWLDNDKRQMNNWIGWLQNNSNIKVISKDFTSTRQWSTIEPKVNQLIEMLKKTGRSFNVLIIGTGARNAFKIVKLLSKANHKVTVVTSAPILKALRGSKYIVDQQGRLSDSSCDKSEYSFSSLILHNLKMFKQDLQKAVLT